MTHPNISPDQVAEEAGRLLNARVEIVRSLATKAQRRADLQAQLADADADYAGDWASALKTGWSERELTSVGLDKPGTATRRKRPKASASQPSGNGNGNGQSADPQSANGDGQFS